MRARSRKPPELLRARGVTQTPARILANLLLFEILCDAVADGDTATLDLKERDILARLAADVDALLEKRRPLHAADGRAPAREEPRAQCLIVR